MDLSNLATKEKSEKGSRLYFVAPDGRETTLFMDVLGQDSDVYLNRINQVVLENVSKKSTKKESDEEVFERGRRSQLDTLCLMIVGWGDHANTKKEDPREGKELDYFQWGDKQLACTDENKKFVFEQCPWMKEQVNKFMGDRANFL